MNSSSYFRSRNKSMSSLPMNNNYPSIEQLINIETKSELEKFEDAHSIWMKRKAFEKKRYDDLVAQVSFNDANLAQDQRRYIYRNDFRPYVYFFRFLAKRPDMCSSNTVGRLKLWFPDTIINSEGDQPAMWLYSSHDGYVYRTDNFTSKNITTKIGNFGVPDELVAVSKKPILKIDECIGNEIKLITVKDLGSVASAMLAGKAETCCIQKYIKPFGPKAFIARTCWRRNKNTIVWIITNKTPFESDAPDDRKFIAPPRVTDSCVILKTSKGKYVDETSPLVINIVKYIENQLPGAYFEEFIGDFVKDESENWWLINVKGFVLKDRLIIQPQLYFKGPDYEKPQESELAKLTAKAKAMKKAVCRYCEDSFPVEELLHSMTLKNIIQVDKHLINRGKNFEWLGRSDTDLAEIAVLADKHKVCDNWYYILHHSNLSYKLYQETEKLRETALLLARTVGIPTNVNTRLDSVSLIKYIPNMAEKDQKALELVNLFGKDSEIVFQNEEEIALSKFKYRYIKRFKMMFYLHMLYDIPDGIDPNSAFNFVEFTLFNQKQRYKINHYDTFTWDGTTLIPLNKLRIFYLFSPDRNELEKFIKEQKHILMELYFDDNKVGVAEFPLNDFLSDKVIKKEELKYFSGKLLPVMSWGMKVTIGIAEEGPQDVMRIKLNEYKHVIASQILLKNKIFIPSNDYFSYEPLPDEWLLVFEETYRKTKNLMNKSELKHSRISPTNSRRSLLSSARNSKSAIRVNRMLDHPSSLKSQLNEVPNIKRTFNFSETKDETSKRSHLLDFNQPSKYRIPLEGIADDYNDKENEENSYEIVNKILAETIDEVSHPKKVFGNNKPKRIQSGFRSARSRSGTDSRIFSGRKDESLNKSNLKSNL